MAGTLVFAPGVIAAHSPWPRGSASGGGIRPDVQERELYSGLHSVFWSRPDSWTELANQAHWWEPRAQTFVVTFTTANLQITRPTEVIIPEGGRSAQLDQDWPVVAGSVGLHRIKKIFVTKPTGLMFDRSDIDLVLDDAGTDLAVTVVGLEAATARPLAARFAAATAQRRLQELDFLEEHEARSLEAVAFGRNATVELDWAWIYELPASH